MNYRHAYHAGNFADVLKHATLALVIAYLKKKDAAFRVVDTHAGSGAYALDSEEALKTSEWERGIGRLLGADAEPLPVDVAQAMAPYLDVVRAENGPRRLTSYPGSPRIAQRLIRAQDALIANELHPEDSIRLKRALGRDRRVKVLALDGWVAVKSLLPPKERRGVVLIDPPFEKDDDLEHLAEGLQAGLRRFATGIFLAWFPIKEQERVARFYDTLTTLPASGLLRVELLLRGRKLRSERLNGCGLIVANPPYALERQLAIILPELVRRLGDAAAASFRIDGVARGAGRRREPERVSRHRDRS